MDIFFCLNREIDRASQYRINVLKRNELSSTNPLELKLFLFSSLKTGNQSSISREPLVHTWIRSSLRYTNILSYLSGEYEVFCLQMYTRFVMFLMLSAIEIPNGKTNAIGEGQISERSALSIECPVEKGSIQTPLSDSIS